MPDGLLLIFAHPDDESFIAAGTACHYRALGVRVALVCATLGQAGKAGEPPVATRDELPRVREQELRDACRILDIELVGLLGYEDRHLAEVSPAEIRERLVRAIRSERPRVVVTFDPNGANVHPDHVAISRFTADAVSAAADPRWLPETGAAHGTGRLVWTPPLELAPPHDPARAAAPPGVDFVVDIAPWVGRKERALRAHRSQHLSIDRVWFDPPDSAQRLRTEMFRQAWGPPLDSRPQHDLFSGL